MKSFKMEMSVEGRIRNLNLNNNNVHYPVYEAVVNSIQSIQSLNIKDYKGEIVIDIIRDTKQETLNDNIKGEVLGFRITDNGVGLDEKNFESFLRADSDFKYDLGCKGVGRFTWFKVYKNVNVESIFKDSGKCYFRKLEFDLKSTEFVKEVEFIEKNTDTNLKTIIEFKNFNKSFMIKRITVTSLAENLIKHNMLYLLGENCPKIVIKDEKDEICVNEYFSKEMIVDNIVEQFSLKDTLKEYIFKINHIKVKCLNRNDKNKIYLCGNNRAVKPVSIVNEHLKDAFNYDGETVVYFGFVTGEYLDLNVNQERTDFNISELPNFYLDLETIKNEVNLRMEKYLSETLCEIKQQNLKNIKEHISKRSPQYKHLLKYDEEKVSDIPNNSTEKEIESALNLIDFELRQKNEEDLKKDLDSVNVNGIYDAKKISEVIEKYSDLVNDLGKSSLSQYILNRKVIIELFERAVYSDDNEKALESLIHKTIFPMNKSSDDIGYEEHNLWLIDERLAYNFYISSDISFRNNPYTNSKSQNRPDLLIYDDSIAVTDIENNGSYRAITLFEFKRPNRSDYNNSDNPHIQVINYIRELKKNSARDKNNRPLTLPNDIKFFVYIIADITDNLYNILEDNQYIIANDRHSAFTHLPNHNAYIEVSSFHKLVTDSTKRNKILFDKLFRNI